MWHTYLVGSLNDPSADLFGKGFAIGKFVRRHKCIHMSLPWSLVSERG